MALDSPGSVHIVWYATGFRGDQLQQKLIEIAAVAPRYGSTHYVVYRSRDDRYRFLQIADFNSKLEWERYWYGPEFEAFRATASSWYQVPVTYVWNDRVAIGGLRVNGAEAEQLEAVTE